MAYYYSTGRRHRRVGVDIAPHRVGRRHYYGVGAAPFDHIDPETGIPIDADGNPMRNGGGPPIVVDDGPPPMCPPGDPCLPTPQQLDCWGGQEQEQVTLTDRMVQASVMPQIFLGLSSLNSTGPGLAGGLVIAGGTAQIATSATVPLRVTDITMDPTVAGFFTISQFIIGTQTLVAGGQSVPASMFLPNSNRPPVSTAVLFPGSPFTLTVTNTDAVNPHRFDMGFHALNLTPLLAALPTQTIGQ